MAPPNPLEASEDTDQMGVLAMPALGEPGREEELTDYLEQLEHALGLVATYARHEPELALWCCRRSGELVLRIVHVHLGAGPVRKRHPSFDDLCRHALPDGQRLEEVLWPVNVNNLRTLQNQGNIGVHARRRGRDEAWAGVASACAALTPLMERLFSVDVLGPEWRTAAIDRHLATIATGGADEEPHHRQVQALEQKLAALQDSHAELQQQHARVCGARDQVQAQVIEATARARAAEAENVELKAVVERERATAELVRRARRPPVEPQSPAPPPPPKRRSWLGRAVRLAVAGAAVGAGSVAAALALAVWVWQSVDADPSSSEPVATTPETLAERPEPKRAAAVQPVAAAVVPAKPAPIVCPDGTHRVEASRFKLSPPADRRDWPGPVPTRSRWVEVEAFCIQARPVLRHEPEAHSSPPRRAPCEGNEQVFDGLEPAACISQQEAQRWCRARGGDLPSVAQWEAVARASVEGKLVMLLDREWVVDAFPAEVFGMGHLQDADHDAMFRKRRIKASTSTDPRWSWNRHSSQRRWTHFGFRCVFHGEQSG